MDFLNFLLNEFLPVYIAGGLIWLLFNAFLIGVFVREVTSKEFIEALLWPVYLMHAIGALVALIYNKISNRG